MAEKVIRFEESTYSQTYAITLAERPQKSTTIDTASVHCVVETCLMAMSDYARVVKTKEKPIAIVIDDMKGQPILGLKVEFFEGTADNPEGSWNPVWTFDPEVLKGCTIYNVSESRSHEFFINQGRRLYRMNFSAPNQIYMAALVFADSLRNWLDSQEVSEDTTVALELDGFFKASVTIIDGAKIMTFSADEEVTNLVKDDAKLQATN